MSWLGRVMLRSMVVLTLEAFGPPMARAEKLALSVGASAPLIELPAEKLLGKYGDWTVFESGSVVLATTFGKQNSVFGMMCAETCSYYVGVDLNCTRGAVAAGLFAKRDGNSAITLRCEHVKVEGEEEQFLLIDEDLSDWLPEVELIAISVPVDRGKPLVRTFSMKGAEEALDQMLTRAEELHPDPADTPPVT